MKSSDVKKYIEFGNRPYESSTSLSLFDNSVLKKYIIDGYAINEKCLQALEKTVDIQTRMIANRIFLTAS